MGCREPLPGLHERYTAVRWRQVLGSTMHCVAGDGVGIVVGAVIASAMQLTGILDVTLEYVLGFGFGWTIIQALFMRGEAGGSYKAALRTTFFPELLSMNVLMAGMVATRMLATKHVAGAYDPAGPAFWFVMSMALLVGFVVAYPMNWWLVSRHLMHGMMTVRRRDDTSSPTHTGHASGEPAHAPPALHGPSSKVPARHLASMAALSFALFASGLALTALFGGFA